jgi:flavin reductase (DIM6/NTAB) family NADH-FMN oxidoreductase RutF
MPGRAVTAGELRATMGHLASGVTIITSVLDGEDIGMTATAFCSVSLEPPLVLLAVGDQARMYDALLDGGTWAVSILPASARDIAARFAVPGRPSDRLLLADLPWRRGPATGHVLLDGAIAVLECRTEQRVPAGDHAVIIGRVVSVHTHDPGAAPLVHFRGRYRTVGPVPAAVGSATAPRIGPPPTSQLPDSSCR